MIRKYFFILFLLPPLIMQAQQPDHIYDTAIRSVKLFADNNQTAYPIMTLNGRNALQLTFDDLDAGVKNYYYTYQLCNADWSPVLLNPFEYIQGFQSVRISQYRQSSIAFTRYTNYQATIPDRNCVPTHSGNYLLKVFLDGDTSKLVFTHRFLVVDNKSNVAVRIQQPFNARWFNTYQKINVSVTTDSRTRVMTPQDLKVVVLQNYIWPSSLYLDRPTIYRGNYFEYSDETQTVMPAGKEWRWIDLRSLRLVSERMQRLDKKATSTDVIVKPDGERQQQPYIYYGDINGMYTIESRDNNNPFWQADYAHVLFSYFPPGNRPYEGKSVYLFGQLTHYTIDDDTRMQFNAERGAYEKVLFLKQGFYNYNYVTVADDDKKSKPDISFETTEGNYWNTENLYTILVYYRPFGARADELIGFAQVNSIPERPGF